MLRIVKLLIRIEGILLENVGYMKKSKYRFTHFIMTDGESKQIDPSKIDFISNQCKLFWTNMSTGKEHEIVRKMNNK